jgi:hypothetical protein
MKIHDLIFPEGNPTKKSTKAVRVLGIDLGTTNSTIAEIVYEPAAKTDISVRCLAVEQPTGSGATGTRWCPLLSLLTTVRKLLVKELAC